MTSSSPGSPDELPAQLGEFRVHGLLGEGGSGTVYDATWGHRRVALKVLRRELLPTERERQRFLDEAGLLQAVDHAGVVKVLGSGTLPDGRPYLAMERLEGESLAERVRRGPIPVADALRLLDQLASAVHALHARGLIHRDVKPENVILTGEFAVLLDFGIAKSENAPASTITQEGSIRGTPEYMAPERFFGAPASIATDVYELAVTFYAMVTARLPWHAATDPTARLDPARPSSFGFTLPGDLESVLLSALSTRAEARPRSLPEFARRMHDAAAGAGGQRETENLRPARAPRPVAGPHEGVSPHAATVSLTQPSAPRSHRRGLLLAVAVIVLAGGLVAVLAVTGGDEPRATLADTAAPVPPEPKPEDKKEEVAASGKADVAEKDTTPPPALWPRTAAPAGWMEMLLDHHPADTIVLVSAAPRRLRASNLVKAALAEGGGDGEAAVQVLNSLCGFDVLDSVEVIAVGASAAAEIDVSARGSFKRAALEKCVVEFLSEKGKPAKATRMGAVTQISGVVTTGGPVTLWVAWPDDHSFFATARAAADEAWMKKRLAGGAGSAREATDLAPLLDEVDTGAELWVVAAPSESAMAPIPTIKPPRALHGSVKIQDRLQVYAGLRYAEAADASETARVLGGQLAELKKDAIGALLLQGAGFSARDRDAVFTLDMNEGVARMTASAIGDYIKKQ